jgi:hypothetical protein
MYHLLNTTTITSWHQILVVGSIRRTNIKNAYKFLEINARNIRRKFLGCGSFEGPFARTREGKQTLDDSTTFSVLFGHRPACSILHRMEVQQLTVNTTIIPFQLGSGASVHAYRGLIFLGPRSRVVPAGSSNTHGSRFVRYKRSHMFRNLPICR